VAALAIARLELFRLFGTKRGWVAMIALLLVWLVILLYVISPAANMMSSEDVRAIISVVAGFFGLGQIANWPSPVISSYWILCLYMLPFFCVVIAADQIASDKFRGTLRYMTLRTSRTTVFFGRFLGQAFIQFFLVAATLGSVVVLVAIRSPDQLANVLSSVPAVLINVFIVLLPYIALMSLVSVLAKSAMQAILFAIIGWILVLLAVAIINSNVGPIGVLDYLLPGSQVSVLATMSGWDTIQLSVIPLLQTAVLLAMGWFALQRSDI